MAFIPIRVEDLRVGLFVKLECLKRDNPFSEKEFKITSPITLAVLKEIPHVRLFFDPALSERDPSIVGSLPATLEQEISGDQPITVTDSNLPPSEFAPSPSLFPAGQPSLVSDFLVDQSQPSPLEREEGQNSETHLATQTSSTTESASILEPLPGDLRTLEPAFLILENQENALEPVEGPHATIPEESVPSSESVECDCPDPLEVARASLSPGVTVPKDDNRDLETKEVGDLPIPVAAFSSPETDHSTPPESIEATQNPSDPTPQDDQTSEKGDEPEVSHDQLEVTRTPLPQGATISNDGNRDLETKEDDALPIPVAAFSSPETDHAPPPELIEATQNHSDPAPQGEQMSEMDVEHEVSHEQLLFPSDDLLPQQQEHTQRDKPQICQIQASDLERAAHLYHHACWQTKMALKRMFEGQGIGLKIGYQVIEDLQSALGNQETAGALIDLFGSMDAEDPFFTHAFNVCMLSLLIGREFDLDQSEFSALGLGALLHDIGKLSSPGPIVEARHSGTKTKNPDWLQHCQRGKEKVAQFKAIPPASLDIIYHHHERLNGTGIPQGLKGKEISFLTKIVMVADEYDHLCHQPDPSNNLSPAQALSHLFHREIVALHTKQYGGSDPWLLDGELIPIGLPTSRPNLHSTAPKETASGLSGDVFIALVKALGVYPPGSIVELTNGTLGLVTGVNFEKRTKPPIMLYNPDFPQAEAKTCDLAEEKSLHIVKSIPLQQLPPNVREYLYAERFV